jgi:histidinol dehydrogenase
MSEIIKDEHEIIKEGEEYVYKRDFRVKMNKEEYENMKEMIKKDILICEQELEYLNEEKLEEAMKKIEEKGENQLNEWRKQLENMNEVKRETEEEYEKRKEEMTKDLQLLIQNNEKITQEAKNQLQKSYKTDKNKYETKLKNSQEAMKIYGN